VVTSRGGRSPGAWDEARAEALSANEGLPFRQGKNVARQPSAESLKHEGKEIDAGGLLYRYRSG
jgi:hypothetical protein